MTAKERLQFAAALILAALWSDMFHAGTYRKLRTAVEAIIRRCEGRYWKADARLAVCRSCPLWYAPLQTCGSPLKRGWSGLGCYCFMPAKARTRTAECWADEQFGIDAEFGWKKAGL
jgi:hypothetical protein